MKKNTLNELIGSRELDNTYMLSYLNGNKGISLEENYHVIKEILEKKIERHKELKALNLTNITLTKTEFKIEFYKKIEETLDFLNVDYGYTMPKLKLRKGKLLNRLKNVVNINNTHDLDVLDSNYFCFNDWKPRKSKLTIGNYQHPKAINIGIHEFTHHLQYLFRWNLDQAARLEGVAYGVARNIVTNIYAQEVSLDFDIWALKHWYFQTNQKNLIKNNKIIPDEIMSYQTRMDIRYPVKLEEHNHDLNHVLGNSFFILMENYFGTEIYKQQF